MYYTLYNITSWHEYNKRTVAKNNSTTKRKHYRCSQKIKQSKNFKSQKIDHNDTQPTKNTQCWFENTFTRSTSTGWAYFDGEKLKNISLPHAPSYFFFNHNRTEMVLGLLKSDGPNIAKWD